MLPASQREETGPAAGHTELRAPLRLSCWPVLRVHPPGCVPIRTFSSAQWLNCVQFFVTSWTVARQAPLSFINSRSLFKLMSIESVMPFSYLILYHPLLLPPSIFPSIRAFSKESVLRIRWPRYWSFSFSISPSNEYSGLISFRMDWLDLLAVQGTPQESSPTPQFKSISSSASHSI